MSLDKPDGSPLPGSTPAASVLPSPSPEKREDPLSEASSDVEKPTATPGELDLTQDPSHESYQPKRRSAGRLALIFISLCLGVFLAALDVTIVTTALPTIAAYFDSNAGYTWIGSAYLLAQAAATPIWGKVSDIVGRKPVLIIANVVFFVGALVASLSNSIGMLIAARAVQGIGGGGLLVLVNIVIGDLCAPRDRGKYYGLVAATWALALSIGPIIGGALAEKVSWRWCFYINLPFDGVAMILLIFFLDLKTPKTPLLAGLAAVDWLGSLLIIGGTLTFLFGLEYGGETFPWNSVIVICLLVFGVVGIILFGLVQWKVARYPTTPIRLFRSTTRLACFAVCFIHGLAMIAGFYYLPLYFQASLGATPILSGVYLLASCIACAFSAVGTGAFIEITGNPRYPTYFGLFFMTLGYGLYIDLDANSSWAKIIIYQILLGLGVGPIFQAPLMIVQSCTAPADVAVATSAIEFTRNIATAISVVVGGAIFNNKISTLRGVLSTELPPQIVHILTTGGAGAGTDVIRQLPPAQKAFAEEAYALGIRPMWYFYVAISGLALLISFLIKKKELSREHKETETGLEAEEANRKAHEEVEKRRRAEKADRKSKGSLNSPEITAQEV